MEPRVGDRLVDKTAPPGDDIVRDWIGPGAYALWSDLKAWIDEAYPAVFAPDWIYGGQKHGWCLRFKKSKAFCTFVPEYHSFSVVVVLGAAERKKVEAQRSALSERLLSLYDAAQTFHDGKWLKIGITCDAELAEVKTLLQLKRPRRVARGA